MRNRACIFCLLALAVFCFEKRCVGNKFAFWDGVEFSALYVSFGNESEESEKGREREKEIELET